MFGFLGGQKPAKPESSSKIQQVLASIADPESPWETCYGTVVKGSSIPWVGVRGDGQLTLADYVIASHACEKVLEMQVDDWVFPIVTDPDGDSRYNGRGLIRAGDVSLLTHDNSVPDDWLIPVRESPWVRNNQAIISNDEYYHIYVRIRYGDQTANEPYMASNCSTYHTQGKFIGHTVAHVMFRTNSSLITPGRPPDIKWRLKGKKDIILNDAGTQTGWTDNAVAILLDFMRSRYGLAPTNAVNHKGGGLESLIAECAETSWDIEGNAPRYTFNGVIRDDQDGLEVMQMIAEHFLGGFGRRGDKTLVWVGNIKTPWADGPLNIHDFAGGITIEPPSSDDWINSIKPHWVEQKVLKAGMITLSGQMKPSSVQSRATYVTEDGGQELVRDHKLEGCEISRRACWIARAQLDAVRLGNRLSADFIKRACVLELGDVTAINHPDISDSDVLFQVIAKRDLDDQFTVGLTLRRYEDALYTDASVSEDEIGVISTELDRFLPLVENLLAAVFGDGRVAPNGVVTVDAAIFWDVPDDARIGSGGVIDIEWKLSEDPWPGHAVQASAHAGIVVVSGLFDLAIYTLRARFRSLTGSAGRKNPQLIGEWSADTTFMPVLPAGVYSPPAEGIGQFGRLPDPFFREDYDSSLGDGLYYGGHFVLEGIPGGDPPAAAVKVLEGGGYWGVERNGVIMTTRARMQITAGDANGDFHGFKARTYVAVHPGETLIFGASMSFETAGQIKLRALYYDGARNFVSDALVHTEIDTADAAGFILGTAAFDLGTSAFTLGTPGTIWRHVSNTTVVPADVSFVRVEVEQFLTSETVPQTISIDGLLLE
jgi:hypothetical protein